ncbi:MAG: hypothetical protein IRY99_02520 [Isosphaeraceae bacterium]|nr:hypothetical protein [Isosphaeraceae bacterium]
MHYKTMILELIQQHPQTYRQLCKTRTLLPTLELYARRLKASHEAWKDCLSQGTLVSTPSQLASEALEFALKELETSLQARFPPDDSQPLSLDAAMAFIRDPTEPS